MGSNFWFYSLSSISQTLAAIIALSATFVIFKLDFLQRKRQDFINGILRFLMILKPGIEPHEIDKLSDEEVIDILKLIRNLNLQSDNLGLGKKQYKKIYSEYEHFISSNRGEYKPNPKRIYYYLINRKEYFQRLQNAKENAYRRLKCNLLLISITIILSLILIPFYDFLKNYDLTLLICSIVIILATTSIFCTASSIWKIATDDLFKKVNRKQNIA
ncbi:MAG: hypothetical protein JXD23_03525 [Spirochaetales bacterium]|nr:hypothetical protein [Spirochaetales bacterium]